MDSSWTRITGLFVVGLSVCAAATCLEPPTREQLEQYRMDGSLDGRIAAAYTIGNHRMSPYLVSRLGGSSGMDKAIDPSVPKTLPSVGTSKVFALLISFTDYAPSTEASDVDFKLFSDGLDQEYPYESLRDFYIRASYDQLYIEGSTLGWYATSYPRSDVPQNNAGREALIAEVINYYDAEGHDFSQYDNDGDGRIDYFLVIWTGPRQGWSDFWWGYQTAYQDSSVVVDGVRLGTYSWQWETGGMAGAFSPRVAIHETGHALGLPDYYDYEDGLGPKGGVGGLDQMDGNWGDHNCFSKWVLGWLNPEVYTEGSQVIELEPSDATTDAVVLMHGDPPADPYGEYFMVQYRRREGNDSDYPTDGLLIWHVDARVSDSGYFLYDNSYTEHKLLRLMEADGLEQIEQNAPADVGDFYQSGDTLGTDTVPSSHRYDGAPTNLVVDSISAPGDMMDFQASLGSGCALYCEVDVAATTWPGVPVLFAGVVSQSQSHCQGSPTLQWSFGDGSSSTEATAQHSYSLGSYEWSLQTELGDATCGARGTLLVCSDLRCWQWQQVVSMGAGRAMHAAVALEDGRVLVAGGGADAEMFDPVTLTWSPTSPMVGAFVSAVGARLNDGRVLVTGSSPGDPVNAALYDPATDVWNVTGQLAADRTYHSAVAMADGRVLVAGGYFQPGPGPAVDVLEIEVFDPDTETWAAVGELDEGMVLPGLCNLADGRVLLTGNHSARIFDPVTDTWEQAAHLVIERLYHVAVTLKDGTVLVAGGTSSTIAQIYDPARNVWKYGGAMSSLRVFPTAVLLDSGQVLVSGGLDLNMTAKASAELYDPATNSWTDVAAMGELRVAHSATRVGGGVLVAGGVPDLDASQASSTTERFMRPYTPPRSPGDRKSP
jgi:M6 family metalloprotease-like protein